MPPLVLVPGMMCDGRLFGPQAAALSSTCEVSIADLTRDDTIEAMARRLLAAAPSRPFVLAGLSLGGIVAMEVLRLAPDRLAHLVLMATNHRPATESFIAMRTEQIGRVRRGLLREVVIDELKGQYFSPRHAANQALRDLVVAMALGCGGATFERQATALMSRRDQTETLRTCRLPSLLIAGGDDSLCPVETHRVMANLMPQGRLSVIGDAGHLLTLEAPDAVTDLLRPVLRATGPL